MRKNPYDEHEAYDEINVVPLLDLAWNLLIVFMIVVTASVQGININLPKASAAVSGRKAVPALPRNSSAALTGNTPPQPLTDRA